MNLKLKVALLENGITQKELAQKTGIHASLISLAIHERYILDEIQKARISKTIGKPQSELFPNTN